MRLRFPPWLSNFYIVAPLNNCTARGGVEQMGFQRTTKTKQPNTHSADRSASRENSLLYYAYVLRTSKILGWVTKTKKRGQSLVLSQEEEKSPRLAHLLFAADTDLDSVTYSNLCLDTRTRSP